MSWDDSLIETDAKSVLGLPQGHPPRRPEPQPEVATNDSATHGWLCPSHGRAVVRTSAKGGPHVGCPECYRTVSDAPSAIAAFADLILTNAHFVHLHTANDLSAR
jgi:hypothetical protein